MVCHHKQYLTSDVSFALQEAIGRSAVRKAQFALIPVCFLIAIVTYLDRSNLAFAASQVKVPVSFLQHGPAHRMHTWGQHFAEEPCFVQKDIGLSNSQYGLASGEPCLMLWAYLLMRQVLVLMLLLLAGILFIGWATLSISRAALCSETFNSESEVQGPF